MEGKAHKTRRTKDMRRKVLRLRNFMKVMDVDSRGGKLRLSGVKKIRRKVTEKRGKHKEGTGRAWETLDDDDDYDDDKVPVKIPKTSTKVLSIVSKPRYV